MSNSVFFESCFWDVLGPSGTVPSLGLLLLRSDLSEFSTQCAMKSFL